MFQWLGKISYSIYLWHYPLLAIAKHVNILEFMSLPAFIGLFFVFLLMISSFSYYFVEETGLQIKLKFTKWASARWTRGNPAAETADASFRGPSQLS